MPTLAELKAEHPEWCWNCGATVWQDGQGAASGHICPIVTGLTATLTAAKLEDEATIRELEGCLIAEQEHTAHVEAQLSAEQAAHQQLEAKLELLAAEHAATKEELRKADEALIEVWPYRPRQQFSQDVKDAHASALSRCGAAALARQAQRAADAAKEK